MADGPADPEFARLAFNALVAGDAAGATALCREGTGRYPWYATGHLVMGKCHEERGDWPEAARSYRLALAIHPDNEALRALAMLADGRAAEVSDITSDASASDGELETILRRFDAAPPVAPRPEPGTDRGPVNRSEPGPNLVSPTLAEIYAGQGEYATAIELYRKLMERRPADAGRFSERIRDLQEKLEKGVAGNGT